MPLHGIAGARTKACTRVGTKAYVRMYDMCMGALRTQTYPRTHALRSTARPEGATLPRPACSRKLTRRANSRSLARVACAQAVAEKLTVDLRGRVKLEDAGFDWKV